MLISETFNELIQYVRVHFATEESILKKCKYPDLENHIKEHINFIEELVNIANESTEGDHSIPDEILPFLTNWLTKHILEVDMGYSKYMKNTSVK